MASITENHLFCWRDIENLDDLHRLQLLLENLPDERLMRLLEQRRSCGRDDYPVRAVWNSILAAVVFEHNSIESLRRELMRNAQLRELCGFDPLLGIKAVPTPSAYTRFLKRLKAREVRRLVVQVFTSLVDQCYQELPGFGRRLGADGKAIESFARRRGKDKDDLRGEHDADWGCHDHFHQKESGEIQKTVKRWFGFTVHVIADTDYELPVAFSLTRASRNEMPVMRKLIRAIELHRPHILERAELFSADRGYDDGKLIEQLWRDHHIKPVIDIRNLWRDGEDKMAINLTIAFSVMLAVALGRVRENNPKAIRSLVKPAA